MKVENIESEFLKDNPLKDPFTRKVVYLDVNVSSKPVIVLYLSGFLSSGLTLLNYDPLGENIVEKADRLSKEGKITNMVIVLPDLFTKLGGNQYINSTAVGLYEDFIVKELIPRLKEKYDTEKIVIMGKSSGGYGSIILSMKYPEMIKGVIDHSGDSYFEYIYIPIFPSVIKTLRKYKSPEDWLQRFWAKENKKEKEDLNTLTVVAMSAFYSPLGDKFELPFDIETGEILEHVWKKWIEKDPVRIVEKYSENLRKLKMIYLDVGIRDEFKINFGMRILHNKMKKLGIPHVYEEFEGGHFNTSFRYDISLSLASKIFNEGDPI
nr:alpha/beta hydrolase-fold protein [Stygiolobus caldivivus]